MPEPTTPAIIIRDVGPRDGLQSISGHVSIDDKVTMIESLARAGVRRIEAGSFVSPRAVPSMADTAQVLERLDPTIETQIETLVLNDRGIERALQAHSPQLVTVVAVSDTFSRRNSGMGRDEALAVAGRAMQSARDVGIGCVADVATAFGCAFEGRMAAEAVVATVVDLVDLGYVEVTLADTIGAAAPNDVTAMVAQVREAVADQVELGLHFHNTRGLGLVNVMAGLDSGVRLFDASVGGIGGCPFSPGATGNISTEDLVHLLDAIGRPTAVDLGLLIETARLVERSLGFTLPGQVLRAGPRFASTAA
jgi:hydroxymethylglutaryl-CoA lyase